jgi:hypothetical protein
MASLSLDESMRGLQNNGMQLTSGGLMRAARASSMRRLQLIPVFCGRTTVSCNELRECCC